MLYGRLGEQERVRALLDAARDRRSGALLVVGEPGAGKSALLDEARAEAGGMAALEARGVQSESRLPYASLYQLLRPALGALERILARWINPIVRGWMNYYGAFCRSALYPLLTRINACLLRWLRKKHPRLRGQKKAQDAWARACRQRPRYFAHWAWVMTIPAVW